jgi:5-methyltetrahydropteroyltriglutamate--homocysteine methyltransferase
VPAIRDRRQLMPRRHFKTTGDSRELIHRAPFRADHVGSFLRPKVLLEAREQRQNGQITAEQLRTVEDAAIRDVVKFQEDIGLQGITDGEYRRTYFHIDFLEQLQGVETKGGIQVIARPTHGDFSPPVMQVTGKIGHARPIQLADFEFLKSVTTRCRRCDPAHDAALRWGRDQ